MAVYPLGRVRVANDDFHVLLELLAADGTAFVEQLSYLVQYECVALDRRRVMRFLVPQV